MYIDRTQWPSKNGQTYTSVWLRESYRDPADGNVKKRAILNLKNTPREELRGMGEAGRRFVMENFDRSKLARKLLDELRLLK